MAQLEEDLVKSQTELESERQLRESYQKLYEELLHKQLQDNI